MNAVPNKTVIEEVALELGINPAFVEKDWYVVQILKIIGLLDLLGAQAIFASRNSPCKSPSPAAAVLGRTSIFD